MLWATVKAVIVFTSIQRIADEQHEREDEQQMVEAGQDVVDAEQEIGPARPPCWSARRRPRRWALPA